VTSCVFGAQTGWDSLAHYPLDMHRSLHLLWAALGIEQEVALDREGREEQEGQDPVAGRSQGEARRFWNICPPRVPKPEAGPGGHCSKAHRG
jgi:hypothetical protein